jgi:MFS family permease
VILLIALTYGIMPYGHSVMGWTSPLVDVGIVLGLLLLVAFFFIERRVREPMFRLGFFRNRMFTAANVSGFLYAIAQGGLTFMLIIWLQGIWLPLHGYNFEDTPLWAGIYMAPMLVGFFIVGPLSGWLSDRYGSRGLTTIGMLVLATGFLLLAELPANFSYLPFMLILVLVGTGMGLFTSPNMSAVMNSVPPEYRGVASGMRATMQNSGALVSMSLFFSVVIISLANRLPPALRAGLLAAGIPSSAAANAASLPPTGALFAAFLGYNPMKQLLSPEVLSSLPQATKNLVLGKEFFPSLMAPAFMASMRLTYYGAAAMSLVAAVVSFLRGRTFVYEMQAQKKQQLNSEAAPQK